MPKNENTTKPGRWALVTGGASGIGYAFACELAQTGLNILLVSRRLDLLKAKATEISTREGVFVEYIQADLSTEEGIRKTISESDKFDITYLVLSAGTYDQGSFFSAVDFHIPMIMLNNVSAVSLIKHIMIRKTSHSRKNLILVSSMASGSPVPYFSLYSATKSFLTSLGCSLYNEGKALGINVITVLPGLVKTDMSTTLAQREVINYKKMFFYQLSMRTVIKGTLKRLGKQPIFVPGIGYKFLFIFFRILPVRWTLSIIMLFSKRSFAAYRREHELIAQAAQR